MLRRRENSLALPAGILAVVVHALFFAIMVFSFSWKHVSPQEVAQVELWDTVPQPHVPKPDPTPEPKPEPPPPPPKPEPKPEPPAPKAEIQLKAKPPVPEVKKPPKVEPKKPEVDLKAQQEEKKREDEKKRKEALRKLQEDLLKDDKPVDHEADKAIADAKAAADAKRSAQALAASSGVVNEYKAKIIAKIRSNVNKELCRDGKPELQYAIALMPTGELSGSPRFIKGNASAACVQAVERAILQSQPLPLPPQPELFAHFRDLTLTFRPNDDQ